MDAIKDLCRTGEVQATLRQRFLPFYLVELKIHGIPLASRLVWLMSGSMICATASPAFW
jgi:hypothetical protein